MISPPSPPTRPARWWSVRRDGRLECQLCPRHCKLRDGQAGFCFVRRRRGDRLESAAIGPAGGGQIDPIEKKPLYHFLPGSRTLSFGTVGCNLGCRFCQNWHLSRSRELGHPTATPPEQIAATALACGCRSVAFTYNDPVIFAEYALDVARACHAVGLRTVAVTAGYIEPEPRAEFFAAMDAANVDLKAFTDGFYRRLCSARLQPVLDTLAHLRRTGTWLEVTTLLIPGANDSDAELACAADWFAAELGPDVPWHFTAFHPDFTLRHFPPTPLATLTRARAIAQARGLHHVYTGNLRDDPGSTTRCSRCGTSLIVRDGFTVRRCTLDHGRCPACGTALPGRFAATP